MPPLQALAALHGFWLLLLLPPGMWAACCWSPLRLRLLGSTLIAFGVLGLVVLAAREATTWLPSVPDEQARYFSHRLLFVATNLTDLPLMQLTLAGTVCWMAGRLRGTRRQSASAGPESAPLEPMPSRMSVAATPSTTPVGISHADDTPLPQRLPEPSEE